MNMKNRCAETIIQIVKIFFIILKIKFYYHNAVAADKMGKIYYNVDIIKQDGDKLGFNIGRGSVP